MSQRPVRVGMISLGCAKNLVDAEVMLGSLAKAGVQLTADAADADVVIVNTCSFIDAAQEESVDAILESDALREAQKRGQGLVVSGCLPQRFREDLPKLLPEVDAFMGIDQVAQVAEIVQKALHHRATKLTRASVESPRRSASSKKIVRHLADLEGSGRLSGKTSPNQPEQTEHISGPLVEVNRRPTYVPDFATPRFRLTPRHFAYVKIAEGCNHPCSFCTIPRMRGSHRSRPQADVVQEVRNLVADGVKEINLISQDSTYYGMDLRPERNGSIASPNQFTVAARALPVGATTLCTLLRELNDLPGEFWIRLLYTHPAHWTDELIQTIADCPKVARYVDMPLQHIHENMLERMRRETSQRYIVDLISRIRARIPGITLRTTFIVGFPGETEACFETLLQFIRDTRFERLGVFTYSQEDGTRAAKMMNQIPDAVKRRRLRRAMAEQLKVGKKIGKSYLGREIPVLVEREANPSDLIQAKIQSWEHGLLRWARGQKELPRGRYLLARGQADAPDIDGRVYVRGDLPVGQFARVLIVGHTAYDMIARPV